MLEMLVYPVSAVMKFWHWLLSGVFGADEVKAWIPSIILLVLTIRAIILPFAWQTFKTSRTTFLMRPHINAVTERYGQSTDPDDIRAEEEAKQRIQKEHGYNPLASCVPALIQIPMFLGLYRELLWMAVPSAASGHRIGVLTDAEVESFRSATFYDVPLPAYVSMTQEQFEFLGTTLDDVRSLALPLIIIAIVLTTTNMVISQLRSRSTLEWDNATNRRVYLVVYAFIPLAALGLAIAGLTGLVPIALLMYWVVNNLFTTTQTAVFWYLMVRRYPATELHRAHQREAHQRFKDAQHKKRARKRAIRRKRASALVKPHTAPRVHRELRNEKRAFKQERAAEKAEKKSLKKERGKARRVMQRKLAEERAAQRAAKRPGQKPPEAEAGVEPAPATVEGSSRWSPSPAAGEEPAGGETA